MKNLLPVYKCEDYNIDKGILVIENPELLGMVQNNDQFNQLILNEVYNAVICPALLQSEFETFDYVKFIY
jgi:hypothetical protein